MLEVYDVKRVLIISDDRGFRDEVQTWLNRESELEAIDVVKLTPYQLVDQDYLEQRTDYHLIVTDGQMGGVISCAEVIYQAQGKGVCTLVYTYGQAGDRPIAGGTAGCDLLADRADLSLKELVRAVDLKIRSMEEA